MYADIINSRF